jgi:uncharacterized protein (TIGR00369 family)
VHGRRGYYQIALSVSRLAWRVVRRRAGAPLPITYCDRRSGMSEATRSGPFWDMIEGRAPMPPVARLLGWTLLSIDRERGEIRVSFEAKPDFLNPAGTVQGGILSAMLDDTMGPAAVALLGGNRFTQTLVKTSFYRPAGPGPIIGFGRVAHRGRDLVFLEGALSDGEGKSLAAATSTARIIELAAFK